MPSSVFSLFSANTQRLLAAGLLSLGLAGSAGAAQTIDANGAPNDFVQAVGNNALDAIKHTNSIKRGDLAAINKVVNDYVLPYVDLTKTTRLSAGRYWRQASPKQQQDLVEAFKGTLIRTYSGAFTRVDARSALTVLPFRGDPKASDVAVRSSVSQSNGPSVGIDYRLEKTAQGWKIYDLNVEGIWLIQNYRGQFAEQISQNGIDGLIKTLNQRNQ
jgi:phospholipid transport system substrate-binding protein